MEQMKIKNHLSEDCEHTVISCCKYTSIECDVKLKRKDMKAHEQDDKAHLNKALDGMIKLEDIAYELKERADELEERADELEERVAQLQNNKVDKKVLCKGEPMIFKIAKFQKRKGNNKILSLSFYTSPNGYNMRIAVSTNGVGGGEGTHVSVYAHVIKGKYDAELNWPFVGKITVELLNQLEDKNHYSRYTELNIKAGGNGRGRGYSKYIPHSELSRDWDYNTQYLKDDTLYFRISVEVSDHKPWLECSLAL